MEKRNITSFFNRMFYWIVPILAAAVTVFVLFVPPRPGVADQGDFQRVMDIAGLRETEDSLANPEFRFFKYLKTEYTMLPVNPLRLVGIIPSSSMIYPILLAKAICKMSGLTYFNTSILAVLYAALYITALCFCLKWIGIKRSPVLIFFSFLSLVVLLDGNYLVWFNSLYGEPMMIIGLLLFIASALYAIQTKPLSFKGILPLIVSSFLFLGSKAQCITALPFIVFLLFRIISPVKTAGYFSKALTLALPVVLLFAYVIGFYSQQNRTCGVDTKFNAVFYGILKNSEDPQRDLEMLGLSDDMAVEAGKHAYLSDDQYEKYVPRSEKTLAEFNDKINNFKLIRFYLQNPGRLIGGMDYTAVKSFQTGTLLGKYDKIDVPESTYFFNRFTFWSDFRSTFFPNKLWFIVLVYMTAIVVSAIEYARRREDKASRLRIELLWVIMAIGIFQFPMPFVGNGEADTAKQLFLFNFTFDILVIVVCTWAFSKIFFSNIEE